ncbi:hypothetical protein [Streptomyces sp. Ag109_O5-1]|uniref:hypothetical protein n=1 Tax=Streptomyces sp. Ag109_O5-1 TaxID=1938851 RepID=UPI000F5053DA|nr:hypothetical protein [Streptomyces sp. Ag109_O5-1]
MRRAPGGRRQRQTRLQDEQRGVRRQQGRRYRGHGVDEREFERLTAYYGQWQGYWGHHLRVGG